MSQSGVGIRAARPGPISFSPNRAGLILTEKTEPNPGPIGIRLAWSSPI